jgi:nicotinamidase/pyrazinamidase
MMRPTRNLHLLIIDPQNDFCDQAGAALPVPGATADLQRVAQLIARYGEQLSTIHVTLDSHHPIDIAHPTWWQDAAGLSPKPFTLISESDVATGIWRARDPQQQSTSLAYLQALARNNRYQLIIWPEHCLIGSWGHAVQDDLFAQLNHWARRELKTINYVNKGSNPATEHYSAICAEVPDTNDAATLPNAQWIAELAQADVILIAGQALSHCVASTVRDLADQLGEAHIHKLVLLTDCTSPVAGFAAQGEQFIAELTARGMQTVCSLNYLD